MSVQYGILIIAALLILSGFFKEVGCLGPVLGFFLAFYTLIAVQAGVTP